jgi:hypothetical protein
VHHLENNHYPSLDQYIKEKLKPVTLNETSAVEMIDKGELEGWCWQSTTFLSVFFDDKSIISRGDLTLPGYRYRDYFHSWIELIYKNKEYVFDPAFNYLSKKDNYYNEFSARVKKQIETPKVRNSLIDLINNSQEQSIYIPGTNNIEDPFFRTNSKVSAKIGFDNKITELNVRFYLNG